MRSHIKMVKGADRKGGDYAITLSLLDETNWSPEIDAMEDDLMCPLPITTADQLAESLTQKRDYSSSQLLLSDFSGHDLTSARFGGSDLSCANFKSAILKSASFSNADLCQADLSYSDCRDANFEDADLSYADLRYSDLRGANMERTRFAEVELKGAKFDRTTKLPISRDEAESRGMLYCF